MIEFCIYEIRYRLRHVSTYVLAFIMIASIVMLNMMKGGVFSRVTVIIISQGERLAINSPYHIYNMSLIMFQIGLFVMATFIVQMFSKDFETKFFTILFTKPIKKTQYIFGRLLGNIVLMTVIFAVTMLASELSILIPGMDKDIITKSKFIWYLNPILVAVIPNLIFISSLFLAIVIATRKTTSVFIVALLMLLFYQFAARLTHMIDIATLATTIDPFMQRALHHSVRGWSGAELNNVNVGLTAQVFINRVVWLSISILTILLCLWRFNLEFIFRGNKKTIKDDADIKPTEHKPLPVFNYVDSVKNRFVQFLSSMKFNLNMIFRTPSFYWITFLGMCMMGISMYFSGMMYGTKVLPVTYNVAGALSGGFTLFFLLLISFYTGELIWASRENKINLIEGCTPIPTFISFLSKFVAMAVLIATYFILMIVVGIVYQSINKYFNFEIGVYFSIFGLKYIDYIMFLMLAFFIHNVVDHKYVSHFVFVILYFALQYVSAMGVEHGLLIPLYSPNVVYSDMAGFGNNLLPAFWFKTYWFSILLILTGFTVMTWKKGGQQNYYKTYLKNLKTKPAIVYNGVLIFFTLSVASYIFYNTNIRNDFTTTIQQEKLQYKYEITYRHFAKANQPKIQDIKMNVDIHPNLMAMTAGGTYLLKNVGTTSIDTLLIHYHHETIVDDIKMMGKNTPTFIEKNKEFNLFVYRFEEKLAPGDSLFLHFNISHRPIGFKNSGRSQRIQKNGTFFTNGLFPSIGYFEGLEISNERRRKKYNLPEKDHLPETTDPWGLSRTLVSRDAHWISFEVTVSTSIDQIALAPGELTAQWTENNRNYYTYKIDKNANNFYAFLSAEYAVMQESWNDIDFEIYHHKDHTYNLDNMMAGLIDAVEYYSDAFGPYTYSVLRIAEFPRYAHYAQAFPTLIPFSEGMGFIADLRKDTIEYPFYISAHEAAHQWWAHQVIPGLTRGAQMIIESFTEYSSLMIVKHSFSDRLFREQLRYSLNRYLAGRATESRNELPLSQVEFQQYIFYAKGLLTMNALSRMIGEDTLNQALGEFADKKRFTADPYPNTADFMKILDFYVADSLKTIVDDMFHKVVLHEHEIKKTDTVQLEDGRHRTSVEFTTVKRYYDTKGNPTVIDYEGWLEIGLLNSDSNVFHLEKVKINQKNNNIEIITQAKPAEVVLDPYILTLNMQWNLANKKIK